MKIKTEELQKALAVIKPALATKAVVEQTDHFIFEDDLIRTFNDKLALSFPFETGLNAAVKAAEFYALINKIKTEELEMVLLDNGCIEIEAGTTTAEIMTHVKVTCPVAKIKATRWNKLPPEFPAAAWFCSFSAQTDDTAVLSSLWMSPDGYLYSTDTHRASRFKVSGKMKEVLLKAKRAKALKDHKPVKYVVEENWAHFKNEQGSILSVRRAEGTFPDKVKTIFDKEGTKIPIPKGLGDKIDIAKIISEADEDPGDIEIKVSDGKMTLTGSGTLGRIKEQCDIDYVGDDFEFDVAPESLLEIISHIEHMYVAEYKLYFPGKKFEHVISLR